MFINLGKSFADIYLLTSTDEMIDRALPPEISNRFIFMERLAANEYSETFLLMQKNNKNKYVLKCYLKPEIESLGHETELLHGLQIDGLPRYEADIKHDDTLFVLREYIEGIPLDEYISDIRINNLQAVDITINLCDILHNLHSMDVPIIHRDIKPSNIIIKPQSNTVTLIDFEIARRYSENADTDTTFFGTRKYAPPEQYGFSQTDCRTDIYALGIVLRSLLTGSEEQGIIISDRALERIVSKCVAFSPKDRYQSVAALKRTLIKYRKRGNYKTAKAIAAITAACVIFAAGMLVENYIGVLPAFFKNPVSEIIIPPAPLTESSANMHTDLPSEAQGNLQSGTSADTITGTLDDEPDNAHTVTPDNTPTDPPQQNQPMGTVPINAEQKAYVNDEGYIVFPDPAFEAALVDMYIDDGIGITPAAVSKITSLNVSDRNITSLAGIEFFTDLEYLTCPHNKLTGLDLSDLQNLIFLDFTYNNLTTIDFSSNLRLVEIHCADNQLTKLDLKSNIELTFLNVGANRLTELDLSNNTRLKHLISYGNQFTEIDFSNNTLIETINVENNLLTELDVSNNPNLRILHCKGNRLTMLDVSKNPHLEDLGCEQNHISSRDMVTGVNRETISIFTFEPQYLP
ncbi:MAG: protein kinase [Oscillospiraceae bacterium]|jgi:serine/threonine protein kinase|nr:protein kinase [Oscillospiraceae bacterium]